MLRVYYACSWVLREFTRDHEQSVNTGVDNDLMMQHSSRFTGEQSGTSRYAGKIFYTRSDLTRLINDNSMCKLHQF